MVFETSYLVQFATVWSARACAALFIGGRPKGRKWRPKADSGGGVLGEGLAAPSLPTRGSGAWAAPPFSDYVVQNNAASEASRKIFGMYPH